MDPFVGTRLPDLDVDDLDRLVSDAIPEGPHLEYKQELGLDAKDQKKEFLRDITAFANSDGGLIVYGVQEERGLPCAIPGITVHDRDALVLKVEHLLKDGIDERLPGNYEIHVIDLAEDRCALMVRVPPSLRAPHMVILGGDRRFFVRASGGKHEMSTAQIRDAVLRSDSFGQRIRQLVDTRINRLKRLASGNAFWVLHLVPLVRTPQMLDITTQDTIMRLRQMGGVDGGSSGHCLEGFRVYWQEDDDYVCHGLTFRDGSIEFFDKSMPQAGQDQRLFPYVAFHDKVAECLEKGLTLYREGLLNAPVAISLGLVDVSGYSMPRDRLTGIIHLIWAERAVTPGEDILPEPVVIADLDEDVPRAMKPIHDFVWNAFGQPRCLAYNEEGEYVGFRR